MVASHTSVPLGTAKWLGKRHHTPGTLPLGKGQEPLMSPTQGQAIIIGLPLPPAISKHLKAFLYGWLPLSDAKRHLSLQTALCPMPIGIFSLLRGMTKQRERYGI